MVKTHDSLDNFRNGKSTFDKNFKSKEKWLISELAGAKIWIAVSGG